MSYLSILRNTPKNKCLYYILSWNLKIKLIIVVDRYLQIDHMIKFLNLSNLIILTI